MIIWIDGTFGVGKTSVIKNICEKLNDKEVIVINSDCYFRKLGNKIAIIGGGTLPQNNEYFLKEFKEKIETIMADSSKIVFIDMALTEKECKEKLFDYFNNKYNNVLHFILTIDFDTFIKRIDSDTERDKDTAVDFFKYNVNFLRENYKDAIFIDTNKKSIGEVANTIIKYILNNKNV